MGLKVLHTADLHFGMENYGRLDPASGMNRRLIDFREAFARALDYALERDVDLVLIAGDCFRSRDPSATHQREFAVCLKKALERRIPVVIVLGNHDTPNAIGRAHALAVYGALGVPRLTLFDTPGVKVLDTFHGPLQIAALPYLARSFLLDKEPYKSLPLEEVNRLLADKCASILEGLAEQADPMLPTILAYHGSVGGAEFGNERSVMIGHDLVIPYSALDVRRADGAPAWDYVALGHIHKHQDLNEGRQPPVVYPGSIERVDFGEEREDKGFCWVNVERGLATYEFVRLPARPFVTLRLDCSDGRPGPAEALEAALAALERDTAKRSPGSAWDSGAPVEPQAPRGGESGGAGAMRAETAAVAAERAPAGDVLREAVVRVMVTVSPEGEAFDDRPLRARLAEAGVYLLAGIAREVRGAAVRGRDSQLTERMGPLEAAERYIASAAELAPRREKLIAAVRDLLRDLEDGAPPR
jgi:exonuclease SbcD